MKALAWSLAFFFTASLRAATGDSDKTVVMLHGLGLRSWAMERLAGSLRSDGFRVVNLSYPSRTVPIEKLASEWLPAQLHAAGLGENARVDFVTHSMGGIILRLYRRDHPDAHGARAVMIAPPNDGSAVVDHLKGFAPFQWFTGVNGDRLGTDSASVPRTIGAWPPAGGELGIIAGDSTLNPLFSSWLGGPNDGKVAVASTRLAGMTDFIVLHHSHTWLQWRGDTSEQVRAFLHTGHFNALK